MRGTEFKPTVDQRALVESAAAFGLTQADIANQLGIQEKTLRKHFREELNSGKFKVDMIAGKTVTELMKSKDERVRLEAAKYYTSRRMGWKETSVNENVGKDGGPIETKDVSAIDVIRSRIADAKARLGFDDASARLGEGDET
jgi:AraC-like DNA-binding protein